MQQQKSPSATSIFCAAAPSDTSFLAQWERHLLPLIQVGRITIWSEQHLMAGADRLQQISDHLDHAHVIVFLLSAEFFASNECMTLMERALKGSARVIPLLLGPVDWKTSKLADLACLPANGQFVTTWDNQDQAFHMCVNDLRQLLGLPAVSPQSRESARVSALQNQNRARMLRRLRRSYAEMMSQSLQGAAWLELGLSDKPDAVQNAANLLLRVPNRPQQLLPPGTSITEVYDEAEHELLILGEPGAGKSILLLDLAQELVGRAEHDETHPLPVILPLSSWATKHPKLEDWIAEQTSEIYNVPRKVSREWVKEGRILPLLDGLDEMDEAARPVCIATINTYHREHLAPLVVCSRTSEYTASSEHHRIALQGAVVVQPLTHEDVETYLIQAGKPLSALRSILKKNTTLHDLATTPLMLNILTLTYQGTPARSLSTKGSPLPQQVWDDYIERMVVRKGDYKRYPLERTRAWLGWLARQMKEHNRTIFYLEQLQPDWLTKRQKSYYQLSTGLFFGLASESFWLLLWLVLGLFPNSQQDMIALVLVLVLVLVSGLGSGLAVGIFYGLKAQIEPAEELTWSWRDMESRLAAAKVGGLFFGLFFGLAMFVIWGGEEAYGLITGDPYGMWWIYGLVSGLSVGAFFGLIGFLIVGLIYGFSGKQLVERKTLAPNEGIRRSLKNGVVVGLVCGLVIGLISGLIGGLIGGLIFGLSSGSIFGLLAGLGATMQHCTLRFWLTRFHLFPWKAPQFLDDATARFLLRRIGGGYSFAHRLLLDHLADVETNAMPSPNTSSTQSPHP